MLDVACSDCSSNSLSLLSSSCRDRTRTNVRVVCSTYRICVCAHLDVSVIQSKCRDQLDSGHRWNKERRTSWKLSSPAVDTSTRPLREYRPHRVADRRTVVGLIKTKYEDVWSGPPSGGLRGRRHPDGLVGTYLGSPLTARICVSVPFCQSMVLREGGERRGPGWQDGWKGVTYGTLVQPSSASAFPQA